MKSVKGGDVGLEMLFDAFNNCQFLQDAYNQAGSQADRDAFLGRATSLNCPGTNGNN